jgi:hypothetical protein
MKADAQFPIRSSRWPKNETLYWMVTRLLKNHALIMKVFYERECFLLCVGYRVVFPNISPLSFDTSSLSMPFDAISTWKVSPMPAGVTRCLS